MFPYNKVEQPVSVYYSGYLKRCQPKFCVDGHKTFHLRWQGFQLRLLTADSPICLINSLDVC